jgi:hypothetical protein
MGEIVGIRGAQTNKPNKSRAIPDTGHIKPLAKEAGGQCRVVHQDREEDESLNVGTLFANSCSMGVEDYDVMTLNEMRYHARLFLLKMRFPFFTV